jgi:hypothetical protein
LGNKKNTSLLSGNPPYNVEQRPHVVHNHTNLFWWSPDCHAGHWHYLLPCGCYTSTSALVPEPHHSVIIYDSNTDNIMTLCRLRRASGRPPDGSWYMLCTGRPSNI